MIVNVHTRHSIEEYLDGCAVCDQTALIHESHDETPDWDGCPICRGQLDTFLRFGGTLFDTQAPDPSWTQPDGCVVAPLVNRGTLDG